MAERRSVKPRAVVFDLDGTLVDSRRDIAAATNHVLEANGFASLGEQQIASYVGDGARRLLARAASRADDDRIVDKLLVEFVDYYTLHATDRTRLVPDARQVLEKLAHWPLALCTNKPRRTTDATLTGLGLNSAFRVVVAGGDLPRRKPDPQPLCFIARQFRLDPAEIVMVGDAPQDIECAHLAGSRSVGVEDGIAPREQLVAARPDALIALSDLPALLERWQREVE